MLIRSVLWVLLFVFLAYALYRVAVLFMKKYNMNFFDTSDNFQAKPIASVPAPVITMERVNAPEIRGATTPAGPNPPNVAAPPEQPRERLPEETPLDTMDQVNSTVPIKDNLRHPERMFNAGGAHDGTKRGVDSGIAGDTKGKFSPDFAQNGGEFMTGIFANDMVKGDNFAEI